MFNDEVVLTLEDEKVQDTVGVDEIPCVPPQCIICEDSFVVSDLRNNDPARSSQRNSYAREIASVKQLVNNKWEKGPWQAL